MIAAVSQRISLAGSRGTETSIESIIKELVELGGGVIDHVRKRHD